MRARDGRHLDFAGRGAYQGITRDHYVELELPDDGAAERARSGSWPRAGSIPTDSSINVAIGQGAHARPRGLSLQVADAAGRFRKVRDGLGFPSGKDKTVLIDLTGVFPRAGAAAAAARDQPRDLLGPSRLGGGPAGRARRPAARSRSPSAELRYRGYSVTRAEGRRLARAAALRPGGHGAALAGPGGLPHALRRRAGAARRGRRPLRDHERRGRDAACASPKRRRPRPGCVRDFVLVGDGWVKDGDFNTTFSRTVLPLPTHASGRYDRPPGELEDDPVYRAHRGDFETYHTRYVSPGARARDHGGVPGTDTDAFV